MKKALAVRLLLFSLWRYTVPQELSFDPREATIASVHDALFTRHVTCRGLVSAFLARIEAYNPLVNAIITLNPDALQIADTLDEALARGNASAPLFCVPILLKENYDALLMPTTGACRALNSSFPTEDAPSVTALRNAGAVVLGKTNMHELALEGLSVSSLGGQTINPYDSTRTPGGSSGGTGAAIASSFAVFGTGSDTVNSLRSPASANSLFSFRPTRGLISRAGVIPVSYTQDSLGAIGRSVVDIATALTVMASIGYDPRDNLTANVPSSIANTDYAAALSSETVQSLSGIRFGVLKGFFNYSSSDETTPVNNAMAKVTSLLESAGATLVSINDTTTYNATAILSDLDVQANEYRESLTAYLSDPAITGPHPLSMPDLYLKNSPNFLVLPLQYPFLKSALHSSTSDSSYFTKLAGIANLTKSLHGLFSNHNLDAIIYPEQKNLVVPIGSPSQSGRNGILAAVTGSPVITVPIGFSPATSTAPIGLPIGMEILGLPWTEAKLLAIAKGIDDRLHARRTPTRGGLSESVEMLTVMESVPRVTPLKNIDLQAYPTGLL